MARQLGHGQRKKTSAMRLRWFSEAISDLIDVQAYIVKDSPEVARTVAHRIKKSAELLKIHPFLGRTGRVEGTREIVIPGLPYIIIYRVQHDAIEILRVFHAARKWPEKIP